MLKKKGAASFLQRLERCGPIMVAVQLRVSGPDHNRNHEWDHTSFHKTRSKPRPHPYIEAKHRPLFTLLLPSPRPDLDMHCSHPPEKTQITNAIHEECVVAVGAEPDRNRGPWRVTTGPCGLCLRHSLGGAFARAAVRTMAVWCVAVLWARESSDSHGKGGGV